ncbi:MAG: hypothetical protein DHS20C13_28340 [Thermodesulfobacteriota bacterium]|nr:MAG: hypothetical protein DHS20C13_28340 [Thermodesulfobacteriota bacterium]
MVSLFEVPSFDPIQEMIDGFSGFRNFEKKLSEAPEDSPTITETKNMWTKITTGELPSHDNVVEELVKLNNLVDCSGNSIKMGTFECTGNCIAISQTPTYAAPSCVSNPSSANNIYSTLRTSYEQNSSMIT